MPEPILDAGLLAPLDHGSRARALTSDAAWLQAMVDTELALTRALVDAALAPEWMLGVCDTLADASALDLGAIAREGRGGGNPVIPLVKHLGLAAERVRAGASDHIHVGATSQDVLDTAAMLVADRVCGELADRLGDADRGDGGGCRGLGERGRYRLVSGHCGGVRRLARSRLVGRVRLGPRVRGRRGIRLGGRVALV
ncbi:hypothetical protein QN345_05875 [Cryobacterium sp. 10I1]|uniref:hypothetical protein n=1 Tax=Cryobacterium sp. 10I1 TaxID=3048578 RepID=UPI002B22AC1F|nr:hypothetical protein [Cryobacterium sp. 10I1]MEB0304846.1 hypothetical protein [Cryobacterium sp. 10I1]